MILRMGRLGLNSSVTVLYQVERCCERGFEFRRSTKCANSWLSEEPLASEVWAVRYGWLQWIFPKYIWWPSTFVLGRDIIVIIATRYGLDGPGIESWWGARFSAPVLGPNQPPVKWVPGLFPGGWSGRGVAFTTHPNLRPRLKEQLSYTSYPLWAFMATSGVNFTFISVG